MRRIERNATNPIVYVGWYSVAERPSRSQERSKTKKSVGTRWARSRLEERCRKELAVQDRQRKCGHAKRRLGACHRQWWSSSNSHPTKLDTTNPFSPFWTSSWHGNVGLCISWSTKASSTKPQPGELHDPLHPWLCSKLVGQSKFPTQHDRNCTLGWYFSVTGSMTVCQSLCSRAIEVPKSEGREESAKTLPRPLQRI